MELLSSFNSLIWCHFGVGFYLRKHPFLASNNFWWSTLFRLITSLSQFRTRCSQSVHFQVTDFSQLSSFGHELETTTSSNLWENSENGGRFNVLILITWSVSGSYTECGKVTKACWTIIKNDFSMFINFPGYIPNLTSVKDNLKIFNKSMFFKTLPKRTRKMLFNIRALSVFRYSACFAALG
jgi:hypothetical protein